MPLSDLAPETLAQLALTTTQDYIVVLDASLRYLYVNRVAKGLTMDQVLGAHVTRFVPVDDRERVAGVLQGVLDTGAPAVYEVSFTPPNDRIRFYESRVSLLETTDGERAVVIVTNDISARKTELFDLEHFFHLTNDLMAIVDEQGRFLRVNRAFADCMGVQEAEVFGQHQRDYIHPDDWPRVQVAFQTQDGEAVPFRAKTKAGAEVHIELKVTAGVGGRSIAVGRDLSHGRAAEQQALNAKKMGAVGLLAAGVAHDFNNLLTSVLLNAQLATEMLNTGNPVQELLADVIDASTLSVDLAKRLMALSRDNQSKRGPVDVNGLIQGLQPMLERNLSGAVGLQFSLGEALPWVEADAAQLEQVLLNLSLNAQEAMSDGGQVQIRTQRLELAHRSLEHPGLRAGTYVLLQVCDTGEGMSAETRDRAIEPFFTTRETRSGAGLGLSVAHEIVARHKGELHLLSEPGTGCEVRVYLPASELNTPAAQAPRSETSEGPGHILVAEDQDLVRAVVERTLSRAGYRVTSVQNGAQALALLDAGEHFDLLLLDVVMPEMGGAELAELLLARGGHPPIVFASGYSQGNLTSSAFRHIPMLQKPFEPRLLVDTVRGCLDGTG